MTGKDLQNWKLKRKFTILHARGVRFESPVKRAPHHVEARAQAAKTRVRAVKSGPESYEQSETDGRRGTAPPRDAFSHLRRSVTG